MNYWTLYMHKIAPRPTDMGRDVDLDLARLQALEPREATKALARILREGKILGAGESLRCFRVRPSGEIVAFPRAGIWNAIVLTPKPSADLAARRHGSIVLVRSGTPEAEGWLRGSVETGATWYGTALVVEPRYLDDLVAGAQEAGFTVEVEA